MACCTKSAADFRVAAALVARLSRDIDMEWRGLIRISWGAAFDRHESRGKHFNEYIWVAGITGRQQVF